MFYGISIATNYTKLKTKLHAKIRKKMEECTLFPGLVPVIMYPRILLHLPDKQAVKAGFFLRPDLL
jgi:hypothetical protein